MCEPQITFNRFGDARALFRPIHTFLGQNKTGQLGPHLERMSAHLLPLPLPPVSLSPVPFSSSPLRERLLRLFPILTTNARDDASLPPAFKFTASQTPPIYSPGAFPIILLTTSSHLPRNKFSLNFLFFLHRSTTARDGYHSSPVRPRLSPHPSSHFRCVVVPCWRVSGAER